MHPAWTPPNRSTLRKPRARARARYEARQAGTETRMRTGEEVAASRHCWNSAVTQQEVSTLIALALLRLAQGRIQYDRSEHDTRPGEAGEEGKEDDESELEAPGVSGDGRRDRDKLPSEKGNKSKEIEKNS